MFQPFRLFRNHCGILAFTLLLVHPPALAAQSPSERADLERVRDSLAATADSSGLLLLEKRLIDAAKADRNNAMLHLRLGLLSLRLGEMGGHSH
jgi:hypothetical protein